MRVLRTTERWLVAVAAAYGIVFIGYGHAGLPLGLAVPVVWMNLRDAERAITAVAALGAVGILAAVLSFCADPEGPIWRMYAWIALLAFTISAVLAIAISEIVVVTALSSVPMVGCATILVGHLKRGRTHAGDEPSQAG